jgi:hypothetical protein
MAEFALGIGDCVHNLRCAVDFIAWELAGADPIDRETMFPIFDDRQKFKRNGEWRIRNVPSAPRALIEQMQPYNASHPRETGLWAIEYFDAADKHRLLTLTAPVVGSVEASYVGDLGTTQDMSYPTPTATLEKNAVIAILTITPPSPNMQVDIEFTPQIAFGDIRDVPRYVIPSLRNMIAEADRVIDKFRPFFV